eukprot:TRINITY_DN25619_c0_g1_i3.p1 TRINITY_DN25619_c0_g1~~TRINITY_DN25619_c0_g1_i3.p1  ORF type:complete len:307 (+),score=67.21 TRINITY_DN25619_c0_g1_i3:86-922(+)
MAPLRCATDAALWNVTRTVAVTYTNQIAKKRPIWKDGHIFISGGVAKLLHGEAKSVKPSHAKELEHTSVTRSFLEALSDGNELTCFFEGHLVIVSDGELSAQAEGAEKNQGGRLPEKRADDASSSAGLQFRRPRRSILPAQAPPALHLEEDAPPSLPPRMPQGQPPVDGRACVAACDSYDAQDPRTMDWRSEASAKKAKRQAAGPRDLWQECADEWEAGVGSTAASGSHKPGAMVEDLWELCCLEEELAAGEVARSARFRQRWQAQRRDENEALFKVV